MTGEFSVWSMRMFLWADAVRATPEAKTTIRSLAALVRIGISKPTAEWAERIVKANHWGSPEIDELLRRAWIDGILDGRPPAPATESKGG